MNYTLRIFVSILIVLVLGFWGYGYWLMKEIRTQYAQSMEDSLVDFSNLLAGYLAAQSKFGELETHDFGGAFDKFRNREFQANIHGVLKTTSQINAYVTDRRGVVLFDSRDPANVGKDFSRWNDVARTLRGEYGARSTRVDSKDPLSSVFYVAAPVTHSGKIIGVVSVSKPEQSLQEFITSGTRRILLMAVLAVIGASLLAVALSWWLTRPIQSLLEYAHGVARGEKTRPPKTRSREFDRLGQAFDEMRISLEGRKSVENFVQHLTHELKGPLTAIQGAAELLHDDMPEEKKDVFLANIDTESRRARKLLDELLNVAALESRSVLKNPETVSMRELLEEIEASLAPLIAKKKVRLEMRASGEDAVTGERLLIRQAVANLVVNAIDFSPESGVVGVAVESDDHELRLRVSDQGPGVPEYARERIFEKFYSLERPDTGKKSSGLGLSFVREAAALHGGRVELEGSAEGSTGTIFTLILPR